MQLRGGGSLYSLLTSVLALRHQSSCHKFSTSLQFVNFWPRRIYSGTVNIQHSLGVRTRFISVFHIYEIIRHLLHFVTIRLIIRSVDSGCKDRPFSLNNKQSSTEHDIEGAEFAYILVNYNSKGNVHTQQGPQFSGLTYRSRAKWKML